MCLFMKLWISIAKFIVKILKLFHLLGLIFACCAVLISIYLLYNKINKPLFVLLFITLTLCMHSVGYFINLRDEKNQKT